MNDHDPYWDEELRQQLVEVGKVRESWVVNRMTPAYLQAFIQTLGGEFPYLVEQLTFDMRVLKFRLFDELAMLVMSRTKGYGQPENVERKAQLFATDLARTYLCCAQTTTTREHLYGCLVDAISELKIGEGLDQGG